MGKVLFDMSGRGRGRNGRGRGRGGRSGRGRGHNYTGASKASKKGLSDALGSYVFDYGQKNSADQMRTSWEKLVQYVGTTYGQDISNELTNKAAVTIPEPVHSATIMARHQQRETVIQAGRASLRSARLAKQTALEAAVAAATDANAPVELAMLQTEIAMAVVEANEPIPIVLTDAEKTQLSNEWRTYRERNASLVKHRGQTFSLILGQCTQLLQDKMKQDTDWTAVSTSYNPLRLIALIEKTVLAQTEDQYPFATVYDQELALYNFRQESLSNPQWYERFNTKVDVANAIGVTRQHKVLLNYVAKELHSKDFDNCTDAEKEKVQEDSEERYLSYVFMRQSGSQHAKLKVDLQNDFTVGEDRYPKNRQQTLHLLDKYSKTAVVPKQTLTEGASFAQGSGNGGGRGGGGDGTKKPFDKEWWKNKECYNCGNKGHPANACPENEKEKEKGKGKGKADDDKSVATTASVKKLEKELKAMKKSFKTVHTQLQDLREDESDISDSDTESATSHFQFEHDAFQFAQVEAEFEPRIAKLFKQMHGTKKKQTHGTKTKLDLREVILLDSQSTLDLFCNESLVGEPFKSSSRMRLQSNGGNMLVSRKAKMPGYHAKVWFSKRAITNIIALQNLIKQYHVTYDSNDLSFVVHRESENKPDMEFIMHESGLHYYDPRKRKEFIFINTVSGNKEGFTKRQIKGAEAARALFATLSYPPMKDFKWVIRSNQIKDCPVTVEDVEVATKIWGKNIAALKGKTTRRKPMPVARDYVKVPTELLKLHKKITRRSWDVIPMPDTVIARVNTYPRWACPGSKRKMQSYASRSSVRQNSQAHDDSSRVECRQVIELLPAKRRRVGDPQPEDYYVW